MERHITQFEGIRTKCPTLSFMIWKALVQTAEPGPRFKSPTPQEQRANFIELCGHGASAMHGWLPEEQSQDTRLN